MEQEIMHEYQTDAISNKTNLKDHINEELLKALSKQVKLDVMKSLKREFLIHKEP